MTIMQRITLYAAALVCMFALTLRARHQIGKIEGIQSEFAFKNGATATLTARQCTLFSDHSAVCAEALLSFDHGHGECETPVLAKKQAKQTTRMRAPLIQYDGTGKKLLLSRGVTVTFPLNAR